MPVRRRCVRLPTRARRRGPAVAVGQDRTQLVVDLGASSLAISLLAVRQGLFHHLTPPAYRPNVGGDAIDDRLLKFFAKDFTKTTSVPLKVAPASETLDLRAEARLRLALLHTKRTIAASTGGVGGSTATCSVESLKDGLDHTGTINRLRFDMEAAPIYREVVTRAWAGRRARGAPARRRGHAVRHGHRRAWWDAECGGRHERCEVPRR